MLLLYLVIAVRAVYIAVSEVSYRSFFIQDIAQLIIKKHPLSMIIVDLEMEEITQWIN
jgi:hypothetical protein